MNAKWRDAVLVEVQFVEMKSKKGEEWKTFTLNLKSYDGDDLTHKSFMNVDEEKGVIRLDRVFTQIIAANKKPEVLISLKEAIGGQNFDAKDEILKSLSDASEAYGSQASEDYRAFAEKITRELEGFQFKIYWRGSGISSTNQNIKAGVMNAQIVVYPTKQKETIKNKSLEDFLNVHREGSIDDRNSEAVAALDGLDDEEPLFEKKPAEPKKKKTKKADESSADESTNRWE